jgi:predicted acylesterase/phospholipase RssA
MLQLNFRRAKHSSHSIGTSAGAIVGAMYSWGKSPDEILDFFKSVYLFSGGISLLKKQA